MTTEQPTGNLYAPLNRYKTPGDDKPMFSGRLTKPGQEAEFPFSLWAFKYTDKKTGEIIPERSVLQVETTDNRGLVKMDTITVPSLDGYTGKIGQLVNIPVRAWATGQTVNFVYEPVKGATA